jgi:hypothetical protein
MGNEPDKKPTEGRIGAFIARILKRRERVAGDSVRWQWWLSISVLFAAFSLIVWSFGSGTVGLRNAAAGLLLASASGAVGVILGFLFGIPRSLQRDDVAQNTAEPFQSVRPNTNLEQISDWLTKIIVGVGLTQAGKIVAIVQDTAAKIGLLFADSGNTSVTAAGSSAFVLVVMILFSILGFLQGYLWARIYLQADFSNIEQRARRTPEYFEGLMNSYLYMPRPRGFQEALKLREQYKKNFGDALTPRMWTYLVSALGQQYAWKVEEEKIVESELKADRDEVLNALKNALRDDPEALPLLRLQLEPDKGRMPGGISDKLFAGDLRSFRNDPEFVELLRP